MMRSILCVVMIGFFCLVQAEERTTIGNRTTENVPEIAGSDIERMSQYASIRSAYSLGWHPSGEKLLIATRFADTTQLHLVSSPLGTREQLTFFNEPVGSASFSPAEDATRLVFSRDQGGDENFRIFSFDLSDGRIHGLTPPQSRSGSAVWSNHGSKIAYQSNRDDAARFDVWISPVDKPDEARMLVKGTGFYWAPITFSADDRQLLIMQTVSTVDTRPYLADVESGQMRRIGAEDKKVKFGAAEFSKDGKSLYITSDGDAEFTHLLRIDLETMASVSLTPDIPWDVESLDISPDGKTLAFTTNMDGISRLYLLNTRTNRYTRAKNIPDGVIYGIQYAPRDNRLALTLNRAASPADVYVYDTGKSQLTRWTRSETGGLNADNFVEAELVRFPTFDVGDGEARQIPAFIYKPRSATGKLPVMISIHGGPEGQSRPSFSSRSQYLVNELGAAVVVPNVRGSTGYGKTFVNLDNGIRREESVRDIGALLDYIATRPDLDSERVGVIGGSYGGYMVLAAMTLYNERIKAGVEYYGISNFVTFLQNTSDYRRDHRRQEYGDERDAEVAEYLNRTAPINNARKITRPLFVLQGANDPRVPASESEQIVRIVRANGGDVWYLLFDNEGHGFRRRENQIFSDAAVLEFLKTHL